MASNNSDLVSHSCGTLLSFTSKFDSCCRVAAAFADPRP